MNTFETMGALVVLAATAFGAMVVVPGWEKGRILGHIADHVRDLPFDKSCTPDGALGGERVGNCLERNGYRVIRDGKDPIIVKIGDGGKPIVIYRDGNGFGGDLIRAERALRPD